MPSPLLFLNVLFVTDVLAPVADRPMDPYATFTRSRSTVGLALPLPAWLTVMPPQSPFAGPVRLPSPFVSPPTESSRHEVRVTGDAAVPVALSDPWTFRYAQ